MKKYKTLREYRKAHKITLDMMSQATGLNRTKLHRIETEPNHPIKLREALCIVNSYPAVTFWMLLNHPATNAKLKNR